MDNFNGYKLKPSSYRIKPNDVVIRVKNGSSEVVVGTLAIVLEGSRVSTSNKNWSTNLKDWRAIETKQGLEATPGDIVYCVKDTRGDCKTHDSFKVEKAANEVIWPGSHHTLLNGKPTEYTWSWPASYFVVLVKSDAKLDTTFPCFRRAIKDKHIIKFIAPMEGTVVDVGEYYYVLNHTSKDWVAYDNYKVWEPCEDPASSHIKETSTNSSSIKDSIVAVDPYTAKVGDYVEWENDDALFKKESHTSTMTRGRLYKVEDIHGSCIIITNNKGMLDIWSRTRFKRVPDKVSQEQGTTSSDDYIDSLAYVRDLPLSYIPIDSMMCKPAPTNQNSKGKQMNQNLFTDILKLLTQTAQTDLQKAPSTYAFFYDEEGTYEGTAKVANEEEAKALLQKPEHLGYTMRIYSFSDEFTTQIPVVSTIKKVTPATKAPRKPRAAKVK